MRSYVLPAITVSMLVAASTVALAADLPSRRTPPVFLPPPPIPAFTWTGLFVGGNAGVAFDQRRTNSYNLPAGSVAGSSGTAGTLTPGGSGNTVGFAGGAQIGYNYELGSGLGFGTGGGVVLGAVADAQYLGNNSSSVGGTNYTFNPNTPLTYGNAFVPVPGLPKTNLVSTRENENFFGTVRGRLGVAFDRVLVYGTGGLAYNTHATGYTFGGGLEFAITNNVTVGAEYLYVNLDRSSSLTATYVPSGSLTVPGNLFLNTHGGRDTFNVARAVVNYKFDVFSPIAPVVARY